MSTVKLSSVIALSLSLAYANAHAADVEQYTVKLNQIKAIQTQEKSGDELYISVTEFGEGKQARHYQIPSFPSHWLSKYLDQVQDVVLWQQPVQQCQATELIVSLVEEDYVPWNVDDLMGSVRLKISCDKGKMISTWEIPNLSITTAVEGKKNAFNFVGDKGNYQAEFSVKRAKTQNPQPVPSQSDPEPLLQQRGILVP